MDIFNFFPSFASIVTVFISCILIFTFIKPNTSSKGDHKLPPGPPTLPIIGNLHQLIGKPRPEALWDLSKQYGPIMRLQIGIKPYIIINSPSLAKQILQTQDHIFCSRPPSKGVKRITYNNMDVAFSPQSSLRRDKRKIFMSEFLAPKRARSFNHVLVMEIENMVRSLSLHSLNKEVNVSKVLAELVKEVLCKVGFGKNYTLEGLSWEKIIEEAFVILNGSVSDNFPFLGEIFDRISGWNKRLETSFSNLDAFIQMIVDDHQNQTISEIRDEDKDFVHKMIELSSMESSSDIRLTTDDMKALIMDVFLGGIDSTVSAMEFTMAEIIRSPRVMQKLQKEIRNCTGRIKEVKELDITKMTYLKMVVKESLRLHPPAPLLIPHESLSHTQVGGYDVFSGTSAIVNAWAIGRDPNTWGENATEFYPERFEKNDFNNYELMPFGGGRRSCPAINTAPITVEILIANLFYWFDWELRGGAKNEDLDMQEEGELVVHKKLPICLLPTKHNWEE
ncbi:parthenolide synthase-like [Rutidosis leptorrhynchoides]|uniref:parthenolide synthase-like n=1 Tax=Rutidosis leptorrhynchoides TaxID=125765 RepID=UPI003A996C00